MVKLEQNPEEEYDPNSNFSDAQKIIILCLSYTTGPYIIKYHDVLSGSPIFTVDINGFKGPNKWGYDIFSFELAGNSSNGIQKLRSVVYATEKGGQTFQQMYDECFN